VKTRCPACQTTFWVTPEQLKAHAGMVRCGQCQSAFNAIDHLQDEGGPTAAVAAASTTPVPPPPAAVEPPAPPEPLPVPAPEAADTPPDEPADPWSAAEQAPPPPADLAEDEPPAPATPELPEAEAAFLTDAPIEPLSDTAAQELGKAAGLILPRETTEIPGYSRWAEGVMMTGPRSAPAGKAAQRTFLLVAVLLLLTLAGQIIFHARGDIAIALPSLRPLLESLSETLGSSIPLPRRAELVSIETSDLQADPTRGNLLVLQATLRNRAGYAQDYPALELSLTDTQDGAIARRVFQPGDYLPPNIPSKQAFPANSDVAVRLWVEAKGISAAGYRLYVFYP
jgi:predicted Zn finger-like uncharacterized protein